MKKWICWLAILAVSSTLSIDAKPKDKKIKVDKVKTVKVHKDHGTVVLFTPNERRIYRKSLPPGLAKKVARGGDLPPGWQKKLVRGEVMPVVVYREVQRVPDNVLVLLPEGPRGTEVVMIDDRVVRLDRDSRIILDVFDLIN